MSRLNEWAVAHIGTVLNWCSVAQAEGRYLIRAGAGVSTIVRTGPVLRGTRVELRTCVRGLRPGSV